MAGRRTGPSCSSKLRPFRAPKIRIALEAPPPLKCVRFSEDVEKEREETEFDVEAAVHGSETDNSNNDYQPGVPLPTLGKRRSSRVNANFVPPHTWKKTPVRGSDEWKARSERQMKTSQKARKQMPPERRYRFEACLSQLGQLEHLYRLRIGWKPYSGTPLGIDFRSFVLLSPSLVLYAVRVICVTVGYPHHYHWTLELITRHGIETTSWQTQKVDFSK